MSRTIPEQIDAILPQTQCGLCGYGGCMPYAEAMVYEQAGIDLCPPGGVDTLRALGELLKQDPEPYVTDMQAKAKSPLVAVIREAECIGCTKCIQVCPVDAILGSAKQMHTVIATECTGCDLCVPACPVDCIDMLTVPLQSVTQDKKNLARERFQTRAQRLHHQAAEKKSALSSASVEKRKSYIQEALERAKQKRTGSTSL